MSKKKKANKAIRNKYGSKTLEELETEGLVPENFHLFDSIEMEEYNKKFPGFKEYNQKMKLYMQRNYLISLKKNVLFHLFLIL